MSDDELKMDVTMKVWNPFIPTDEITQGFQLLVLNIRLKINMLKK